MYNGTRTTAEQQAALDALIAEFGGVRIHDIRHNLDGLWLNIHFTAGDGDWVASIDRAGNVEKTQ